MAGWEPMKLDNRVIVLFFLLFNIRTLKYRINIQLDIRQDNYGTYRGANTVLTGSSSTPFLSNTASTENGEAWNYDIYHQLSYDKTIAVKFAALDIPTFACTPDRFPELMAAAIQNKSINL